jgi:hypothetical protein
VYSVARANATALPLGRTQIPGDLENTADSVLGLYRDEIDHSETNDPAWRS